MQAESKQVARLRLLACVLFANSLCKNLTLQRFMGVAGVGGNATNVRAWRNGRRARFRF